MRRFSPRDITMYLMLAVLLFFTFSALQQMDRSDAPISLFRRRCPILS